MLKSKWSKLTECLYRRPKFILLVLPFVLILTLYIVSGKELEFENFLSLRSYTSDDDFVDGYLVWNPKCHMLSKDPMDSSIWKFVKKEKFETCSSTPLMTSVSRDTANGSVAIVINPKIAKTHSGSVCCWTPIVRPTPSHPPKGDWDSKITVGHCENFENRVFVPQDVEIVLVKCRKGKTSIYENVHAIIHPRKVQERLDQERSNETSGESPKTPRKLSVLLLGIDSVSRLNFKRSMPKTEKYLQDNDWIHLRGYNKMGENTFPNVMAILTGQSVTDSYDKCKPTVAYGLDHCPMIWYNYRNASFITAYGEELVSLSTFNYRKVGFVDPPTDYYLRPYIVATEKLLKAKKRFSSKYCTGPEISVERIFNYAIEFSKTFFQIPYFGFFWTTSVSHDDMNGLSSMDIRLHDMLQGMERDGILNDTMVIFLSDHGMRWGGIRNTFVGWYEERLPFIYIWVPEFFRLEDPEAYQALRTNAHRLTSPFDLYETLRDILIRAGGDANSSSGCSTCQTLFRPVPIERGCSDAGISPHWCTCTAFKTGQTTDKIAVEGTKKFLNHVENIIKEYKDKKGRRLCAKLKLKKIHRVDKVIDLRNNSNTDTASVEGYFYMIEVTPGDARYEMTIRYHGGDNFTINEDEISRINSYASTSSCLDHGSKRYCHCVGK